VLLEIGGRFSLLMSMLQFRSGGLYTPFFPDFSEFWLVFRQSNSFSALFFLCFLTTPFVFA